jgi:hypothetical protein
LGADCIACSAALEPSPSAGGINLKPISLRSPRSGMQGPPECIASRRAGGPIFLVCSAIRTRMDDVTKTPTGKRTTQVVLAQKAAELKAADDKKRSQPSWLRAMERKLPTLQDVPPVTPECVRAADQSQGPPRLLSKAEVLAIANTSQLCGCGCDRERSPVLASSVAGACGSRPRSRNGLSNLPIRKRKGDDANPPMATT